MITFLIESWRYNVYAYVLFCEVNILRCLIKQNNFRWQNNVSCPFEIHLTAFVKLFVASKMKYIFS